MRYAMIITGCTKISTARISEQPDSLHGVFWESDKTAIIVLGVDGCTQIAIRRDALTGVGYLAPAINNAGFNRAVQVLLGN